MTIGRVTLVGLRLQNAIIDAYQLLGVWGSALKTMIQLPSDLKTKTCNFKRDEYKLSEG